MAKKKIQLNIRNDISSEELDSQQHLDDSFNLLSEKHKGYYLFLKVKNKPVRIYLDYDKKCEFYKANKQSEYHRSRIPQKTTKELFTCYPNHESFVKDIIFKLIEKGSSDERAKFIIQGFALFLEWANSNKIKIENVDNIEFEHQLFSIKYVMENKTKSDNRSIRTFFNSIREHHKGLEAVKPAHSKRESSFVALPSATVYQIDYFAQQDIEESIKGSILVQDWEKKFQNMSCLLSVENLAYGWNNKSNNKAQIGVYLRNAIELYNIDFRDCSATDIKALVSKGMDINIKTEEMLYYWYREILEDFPFDSRVKDKYKCIYISNLALKNNAVNNGVKLEKLHSKIFPSLKEIYSFIVFLMIREGLNHEELFSFRVKKSECNNYILDCEESSQAVVITAEKKRANSLNPIVIKKNSKQLEYINHLIKWLTPIYDKSNTNSLFQHISLSQSERIKIWGKTNFFDNEKRSPLSFYKRHKIYEQSTRIDGINHKRLRPYSNYNNYLKGYNTFVRQLKLNHKNITTQEHYENNIEWSLNKKDKIARVQNKLSDIFSGEFIRDNDSIENLFNGPLADCKNPASPTYIGSKELKNNESCSDWSKCLTQCDKACIIPKIHGPVIYAWKEFLESSKESFLNIEDWEKEYLYDLHAANEVLQNLTKIELEYSKENSHKYKSFVQYKFPTKIKNKVVNNVA